MINKKLMVAVIIPVLVVMSGSLAFSAFTGNITTNVTTTAGTMTFSQDVALIQSNAENTILSVSSNGYNYQVTGTNGGYNNYNGQSIGWTVNVGPDDFGTISSTSSAITTSISLNGLAPGDVVIFQVTITNTGTVGMVVPVPTLTTSAISPAGLSVSPDSDFNIGGHWGGLWTATGFLYNIGNGNGYLGNAPPTTLEQGQSVTYYLLIGLGLGATTQGASFTLTLNTVATSSA